MAKKGKLAAAVERASGPQLAPANDEAERKRYRAEDALRTMKEYQKITSDKELMRDARKLAKDEMKKLSRIC